MPEAVPPIVTAAWLLDHLDDPDVQVVDGSWHLASLGRDAVADYVSARIPDAVHLDIDTVAARTPGPPGRMLPPPDVFAAEVGRLGLRPDAHMVTYDTVGLYSAARVWWMFRTYGHAAVSVLDGGLPAWRMAGGPIGTGPAPQPQPVQWPIRPAADMVRDWRQVLANIASRDAQLVDVRPPATFHGSAAAHYPGVRAGHIPGAVNLSQRDLLHADGTVRSRQELRGILQRGGVDPARPIIATCGSGVTACILALALDVMGEAPCTIYDGSWEEWGQRADLPVAIGP